MSSYTQSLDQQSVLESYKKISVSKEIAKDIILHKVHKQEGSQDGDLKYIFFVTSSTLILYSIG